VSQQSTNFETVYLEIILIDFHWFREILREAGRQFCGLFTKICVSSCCKKRRAQQL